MIVVVVTAADGTVSVLGPFGTDQGAQRYAERTRRADGMDAFATRTEVPTYPRIRS